MIELEIQGLSGSREGLVVEIGRVLLAHGFVLQRQRLVHDPHGWLLTMVVRGSRWGRRKLEAALDASDRFVSVKVFRAGEAPQPHFATSRAHEPYVPPPAPAPAPVAAESVVAKAVDPVAPDEVVPAPEAIESTESAFEFILPRAQAPVAAPVPVEVPPVFDEPFPLEADEAAVAAALSSLAHDYPRIVPRLLTLQEAVAAGARESSLALAGRNVGRWVFEQMHTLDGGQRLDDAIGQVGAPALRALVEVEQQGAQLHIRDSPLCAQQGRSGCSFFGGFLEELLGATATSGVPSIFPVCCRSYGADECVLAISD